jgi:hypothetical protein
MIKTIGKQRNIKFLREITPTLASSTEENVA